MDKYQEEIETIISSYGHQARFSEEGLSYKQAIDSLAALIQEAREDLLNELADIHSKIENPFPLGAEVQEYLKFEHAIRPIGRFFMTKYQSLKAGKDMK